MCQYVPLKRSQRVMKSHTTNLQVWNYKDAGDYAKFRYYETVALE